MYESRTKISKGALEGIRDMLSNVGKVTTKQVANLYPDLVSWADEAEGFNVKREALKWAHDHLQFLNRKKDRVVTTDGKLWWIASASVNT